MPPRRSESAQGGVSGEGMRVWVAVSSVLRGDVWGDDDEMSNRCAGAEIGTLSPLFFQTFRFGV